MPRVAFCMRRVITGTATFGNQSNRDAAYTRMNNALASIEFSNFTSALGTGVSTSGTTGIIISIEVPDVDTGIDTATAVYNAWTATSNARQNSGYLSVNRF